MHCDASMMVIFETEIFNAGEMFSARCTERKREGGGKEKKRKRESEREIERECNDQVERNLMGARWAGSTRS